MQNETEHTNPKPDISNNPTDAYIQNAAKPAGSLGEEVLSHMNDHHKKLADWAFSRVNIAPDARALDIGCGGGANLERLLALCPEGQVEGVDYSATSVKMSIEHNQAAVDAGRLSVRQGDVSDLPYADGSFDFASACETIYFWPDLARGLAEAKRVLAPNGQLLIICEMADPADPRFEHADFVTIYTPEQTRQKVQEAGFSQAELHQTDEWYCVAARR